LVVLVYAQVGVLPHCQ